MKIRVELSTLASKYTSGVAVYTKLLAESLDKYGNAEVYGTYFNFLNRQPNPQVSLKKPLKNIVLFPLKIYANMQSRGFAPAFDLFMPSVDLTIFPNFATWPTVKSKKRATVIHDLTYLYFPELVEEKNLAHLRRVVPDSIKKADFIITVSGSVKNELVKEFRLSPEKCMVTPIPPNEKYFEKCTDEIHKKHHIPTEKFILFSGNLEPRKDLPTLIAAYRQLPEKVKNEYSLVIAGNKGWKIEKSQEALDAALQAGENVIHVGPIEHLHLRAFYQKASLFVMPALYEGFCIPILESLASGTPVLASNIPVLHETGGEAIMYAEPRNPADFSKKMLKALTSPQPTKIFQTKANQQLSKFSWQKNAETILKQIQNN